jgi:hypothetical protein
MAIKAIETKYKGYRFRSRLEARWAVLFDALDLRWEYEKEGFDMRGVWYLPDFWLPDYSLWVEIKPDKPSQDEALKTIALRTLTKHPAMLLCGSPWPDEYFGIFLPAPHTDAEIERYANRFHLPTGQAMLELASRNFRKFNKIARCRRCDGLYWVWETQDGSEYEGGALGQCCDTERYPIEIPRSFYTQARGARFEHGETPE